jgi:type IV pilus assembly protein PilZ
MDAKDEGRRVAPRFKARLKVKFKNAEAFINEYTYNISKGGVFIRTSKPCNMRDKVEIVLIIPEQETEIVALGEVIHVVTEDKASENLPAGMGIQILDFKKEDQEKIEKYIQEKMQAGKDAIGRRQHERIETRIRVKFESKEALVEEYVHNISHGGIFIATTKPKSVGDSISVILTHPETEQAMLLRGEVARVVSVEEAQRQNIQPGMGIKFKEMDPYVKAQLDEFIQAESRRARGKDLIIEES